MRSEAITWSNGQELEMNVVPQSLPLPSMLAARLPVPAVDDPAVVVLGEHLHGLCVALGVPPGDWLRLSQWTDIPLCRRDDVLGTYVDVLVADRCRHAGEDLISDLVTLDVDGDGLTADEIRAIVVGLLTA